MHPAATINPVSPKFASNPVPIQPSRNRTTAPRKNRTDRPLPAAGASGPWAGGVESTATWRNDSAARSRSAASGSMCE